MVFKKHRITTPKLAASLILMFLIGFFLAYNVSNLQHNFFEQDEKINLESVPKPTAGSAMTLQSSEAKAKVLAVSPQGEGIVGDVTVEITPGDGKVLINTNPFVEPDTQYSAVTSVEIAKEITQTDLKDKNVLIDFDINGIVLGGPSAGAAMTIATISAIENKPVKEGVAITGTIEVDGSIGKVGSLIEKGDAAADSGYEIFLIPAGQKTFTYYQKQTVKRETGGFVYYRTRMVPTTIDLSEYFQEKGLNVIEVSNIKEVMGYMF
ncbi:MAG: S16 family serine protease [archaeon]